MRMCCGGRRTRGGEEAEVHETASRAMEILKERFAKGEIEPTSQPAASPPSSSNRSLKAMVSRKGVFDPAERSNR